jgi:hypothetical protein
MSMGTNVEARYRHINRKLAKRPHGSTADEPREPDDGLDPAKRKLTLSAERSRRGGTRHTNTTLCRPPRRRRSHKGSAGAVVTEAWRARRHLRHDEHRLCALRAAAVSGGPRAGRPTATPALSPPRAPTGGFRIRGEPASCAGRSPGRPVDGMVSRPFSEDV